MNSKAWDFLKEHHHQFLLLVMIVLFVGSLLVLTVTNASTAGESEDIQVTADVRTEEVDDAYLAIETNRILAIVNPNEEITVEEEASQEKTQGNVAVAMGGDRIVTREGISFSYTKVLDQAELTAYSAGVEHTGKNPEDYWYGMTFTGTKVQEGRTIAVDPKVIPLGWWVYIEGYGFRCAEDTGSAVKNERIDIYFDDNEFVHSFGLKRGVKVWVIGPNDPRQ